MTSGENIKVDVVYTLGVESKFDNQELRYSLRSLQYFKDLGLVYIIGHSPGWVENFIHIPCQDPYLCNKDANLISKLILGCCSKILSDKFLWFSDDQILLKECSSNDFLVPIIDNSHLIRNPTKPKNRWVMRLERTVAVLKERGHRWDCYESHTPYLIDKELYPKTLFQYDYGSDIGYCGNTLYFNSLNIKGKETAKDQIGLLLEPVHHVEKIEEICKNKMFLNYQDKAINENLLLYLQKKFPNKSQYEQ